MIWTENNIIQKYGEFMGWFWWDDDISGWSQDEEKYRIKNETN